MSRDNGLAPIRVGYGLDGRRIEARGANRAQKGFAASEFEESNIRLSRLYRLHNVLRDM